MAKRRRKEKSGQITYETILAYRPLLLKLFWGAVVIISILYGYTKGAAAAAEGQLMDGIWVGLGYGFGAFALILMAFLINRKLKGL